MNLGNRERKLKKLRMKGWNWKIELSYLDKKLIKRWIDIKKEKKTREGEERKKNLDRDGFIKEGQRENKRERWCYLD